MKEEKNPLTNELELKLISHYRNYYGEIPDPLKNWGEIAAQLNLEEKSSLARKTNLFNSPLNWIRQRFLSKNTNFNLILSFKGYPDTDTFDTQLPRQKNRIIQTVTTGMLLTTLVVALLLIVTVVGITYNQIRLGTTQNNLVICPNITSLECALSKNKSLEQVFTDKLGQEINLDKTINGFTVTVKYIYTDANSIFIAYTISGPATANYRPSALTTLANDKGMALPLIAGEYGGVTNGTAAEVKWYDATGLDNTGEIKLRFQVLSIVVNSLVSTETVSDNSAVEQSNAVISQGPFTFDLTIPAEATERLVEPAQKVTINGSSTTLEKVVISPAETRVYIRGIQTQADQVTLLLNNTSEKLKAQKCWSAPSDHSLTVCSFSSKFTTQVIEGQIIIAQQWIFPFTIPKS